MTTEIHFEQFTTTQLTDWFNVITGKSIKPGSYTKARLIEMIKDHEDNLARVDALIEDDVADYPQEAYEAEATPAEGSCPLCGGDPANQTAAGAEGTFLGDNVQVCHECGKAYSIHSGEEVEEIEPPKSKKRRLLNPQPVIDKKTKLLDEAGFTLYYDRPTRTWWMGEEGNLITMSSRALSEYTPEELLDFIKNHYA